MLKAKVCEQFGIDNLFDETFKFPGIAEARRAVKTHDVAALFIFSGLRKKFEIAKSVNKILEQTNTWLFDASGHCVWSEQIRYLPVGSQKSFFVLDFIELLGHEEGLLQWIKMS
nr:hypothetical protein [Crenothrix polyspora]